MTPHRLIVAALICGIGAATGLPSVTSAQATPVALRSRGSAERRDPPGWPAPMAPATGAAPWWAPVVSLVVPGSGQYALKQQRSVAYVVAEGFLVLQYRNAQRDGNRERDAYRTLAADVARRRFGGTRPLGDWDYYESLEQFVESGAFDRVPGGAVDPETDPTTYNGTRWLLARQTFWRDPDAPPLVSSPEYQRALAFYLQSAVREEFRWSWRDEQLAQNVYIETIRSANRSYQRAVNMLGVVAVNHLVSLVDAYVNVRIRRFGGVGVGGLQVEQVHTGFAPVGDPAAGQGRWQATIRLTTGR
ncbi:MAG: hypothetical protein ACK5XT_02180 [Gemmatimonas sp.]|jgi:hypothetical protein|uniref:hypothetical protein n=1 Tax=Gemmatimonas sp. TaxID=1962908 RepID=UPI00391F4A0B|nr:hypothetical protein [Gemmatimonadota bacterium]